MCLLAFLPLSAAPTAVQGLPTIRAYGAGARFRSAFLQGLSENGAWWFCFYTTGGWVAPMRGCSEAHSLCIAPHLHSVVTT